MTAQRIECHLSIPGPQPGVLEPLCAVSGLPKQRLKDAMGKGAVWLTRKDSTQRLRRKTRPLQAGDLIHLYYDESVLKQRAPEPELVADEGDYSIWVITAPSLAGPKNTCNRSATHFWCTVSIVPPAG